MPFSNFLGVALINWLRGKCCIWLTAPTDTAIKEANVPVCGGLSKRKKKKQQQPSKVEPGPNANGDSRQHVKDAPDQAELRQVSQGYLMHGKGWLLGFTPEAGPARLCLDSRVAKERQKQMGWFIKPDVERE